MSASADNYHVIYKDFLSRHNLRNNPVFQKDMKAIYWVNRVKLEINEALRIQSSLLITQEEHTWGLMLSMLDRVFEYIEGTIVAYLAGSTASCEVIARTVVESSINVMYILRGDRNSRLYSYFLAYLENERKEIDKWLKVADTIPDKESAKMHQDSANSKKETLHLVEKVISQAWPVKLKDLERWPNISERFKSLNRELDYRTVYSAMCSQTHNDAEDLLNYFFALISQNERVKNIMGFETLHFSRQMLYFGVHYYILAALFYALTYKLESIIPILQEGLSEINLIQNELLLEFQGIPKLFAS